MFKVTSPTIAFLLCFYTYAQDKPIHSNYKHYTTEEGLPQSYVSKITQDKYGFLWVATSDGLARFDGKNFLIFSSNIAMAKRELTTNQISDIYLDSKDNLWVLHFNSVMDKINIKTFEVSRDVAPIKVVDSKNFKLRTRGTNHDINFHGKYWYTTTKNVFSLYDTISTGFYNLFNDTKVYTDYAYSFIADSSGRFWIYSNKGLEVVDENGENFKTYPLPNGVELNDIPDTQRPMSQLNDQIIFCYQDRVFLFDIKTQAYKELEVPKVNVFHEGWWIKNFVISKEGKFIFEYQANIFQIESDGTVSKLWEYPGTPKLDITSLLIDKTETLWAGTNPNGLFSIDLTAPNFGKFEYQNNFLYDVLKNQFRIPHEKIPKKWDTQGWAYDFRYHIKETDEYYFSNDLAYQPLGRRVYQFSYEKMFKELTSMSVSGKRHEIAGISGFESQLWLVDKHDSIFNLNPNGNVISSKKLSRNVKSNSDYIADLVVDAEYQWLLTHNNTLLKLQDGVIIKEYQPSEESHGMINLYQDPNRENILWIASIGGGLLKWDKASLKTIARFTKGDGLLSDNIASITPDGLGNLWLGTFNGLSRFNLEHEKIKTYTKSDGLLESEFNRHHALVAPNNILTIGGTKGYVAFDPRDFRGDTSSPEIRVTDISINNVSIISSEDQKFDKININEIEKIELSHDQNSIAIEVAAMQFNNPDKNMYRYMIEGQDDDWVELKNDRKIRFEHITHGVYTVLFNASNKDGIWSDKVKRLKMVIKPPFWFSNLAYLSYLLLFSILSFLYWKNYKKKLLRKQEEEFNRRETKRLKEVDDMKTRFFSNITHEFRTPLTLILSPLEKQLRDKQFPQEVQNVLENNYRHGSHLLRLVNELLDISKLESGFMQTHASTGRLDTFCKECLGQFEDLANLKKVKLTCSIIDLDVYYEFDKSHWEKIISNLLSNAIKFTPEGGSVHLKMSGSLSGSDDIIHISVRDTGIGIAKDLLPKLFNRFYQIDDSSTRHHEGTGIGLSLVKELTELLGGTVQASSEEGEGSTFLVQLPAKKIVNQVRDETLLKDVTPLEVGNEETPVILIAEDNPELRSFIVNSFDSNWKILQAENGKKALEIIHQALPDVVVSDVMMPEMSGYDLCENSKSDPRTAHINFIILTAKTAQESKLKGLESGADDYLTKPFQMYELELRIKNALRKQADLRMHLKKKLLPQNPSESSQEVDDPFIIKLREYLNEHISEVKLNVDKLSSAMSMSRSTLNRKLQALLSISANDFIKQYRLQKATEFLLDDENISQVAYRVGFESPSYFSQCFKEIYALSPSEYQKSVH